MLDSVVQLQQSVVQVVTSDIISFGFFMFAVATFVKKSGFFSFLIVGYFGYVLTKHVVFEAINSPQSITGLLKLSKRPCEKEVFTSLQSLRTKFDPTYHDEVDESMFIKLNEIHEFFYKVGPLAAVNAFKMFGDIPNYNKVQNNLHLENELEHLKTIRSMDFVSNYFMLLLITFVFFYNSAARGFVQKCLVFGCFILAMILELTLGQPPNVLRSLHIPVDEYTDYTLGNWIGCTHLDVPELSKLIRFGLIVVVCQLYVYGLIYQPTAEEKLVSATLWYAWSLQIAYEELEKSYKEKGQLLAQFMMDVWNIKVQNHNRILQHKEQELQAQATKSAKDGHIDIPVSPSSQSTPSGPSIVPGLTSGTYSSPNTSTQASSISPPQAKVLEADTPEKSVSLPTLPPPELVAEPEPQGTCTQTTVQASGAYLERLDEAALMSRSALTASRDFHSNLGRIMGRVQSYLVYGFVAFALYQKYQSQVDTFLFSSRQ